MSPLPDNINLCNRYQPQTRDVQGNGYYHPSEGEYGTVDHSTGYTWWSNPADARERTAVFGIVTGVLVLIIILMFFKIRKLKKMEAMV